MDKALYKNTKIDNSAEELWISFLKGDMSAFHTIYNSHYQMLYNFGLKFLKPAKVEDCIHDTFLNILNYKTTISEVKNVKAYLFKSFRNQAFKLINSNKLDFNLVEGNIPSHDDDDDDEKSIILLKQLIIDRLIKSLFITLGGPEGLLVGQ